MSGRRNREYQEPNDRANRVETLKAEMELQVTLQMDANHRRKENPDFFDFKIYNARQTLLYRLNREYQELTGEKYKDGKYVGDE